MKGTYLGEFEEIVLLAVGILYDEAYGVSIREEIEKPDKTECKHRCRTYCVTPVGR
jgi:hypothetical protein